MDAKNRHQETHGLQLLDVGKRPAVTPVGVSSFLEFWSENYNHIDQHGHVYDHDYKDRDPHKPAAETQVHPALRVMKILSVPSVGHDS